MIVMVSYSLSGSPYISMLSKGRTSSSTLLGPIERDDRDCLSVLKIEAVDEDVDACCEL